jgi:hypothetical protein
VLPDIECKFDNIVPLIPLPEVCHPWVAGGVSIGSCRPDVVEVTGENVFEVDGCYFSLGGGLTIEPKVCSSFEVINNVHFEVIDGHGLIGKNTPIPPTPEEPNPPPTTSAFDLVINYDECTDCGGTGVGKITVTGEMVVESTVVCYEALEFGSASTVLAEDPIKITGSISLEPKEDTCGATLLSNLLISWDGPTMSNCHGEVTVSVDAQDSGVPVDAALVTGKDAKLETVLNYIDSDMFIDGCNIELRLIVAPQMTFSGIGYKKVKLCGQSEFMEVLTIGDDAGEEITQNCSYCPWDGYMIDADTFQFSMPGQVYGAGFPLNMFNGFGLSQFTAVSNPWYIVLVVYTDGETPTSCELEARSYPAAPTGATLGSAPPMFEVTLWAILNTVAYKSIGCTNITATPSLVLTTQTGSPPCSVENEYHYTWALS